MEKSSGVGVLDKAATVLGALEAGPSTLAQLVASTGLARPTAHRLAVVIAGAEARCRYHSGVVYPEAARFAA